jgi:hypothetical protein
MAIAAIAGIARSMYYKSKGYGDVPTDPENLGKMVQVGREGDQVFQWNPTAGRVSSQIMHVPSGQMGPTRGGQEAQEAQEALPPVVAPAVTDLKASTTATSTTTAKKSLVSARTLLGGYGGYGAATRRRRLLV